MAMTTVIQAPVSVELARDFIAAMQDYTTYVVVSGDTGYIIAGKLAVILVQLQNANPYVNWDALQIGQVLQVPGHIVAVQTNNVAAGDTLSSIAAKSGLSLARLLDLNPQLCKVGDKITVPRTSGGGSRDDDPGTSGDSTLRNYSGPASNFPDPAQWQKFSLMWAADSQLITDAGHDTADQIGFIFSAINTVAAESGIDRRVILCTVMQESGGNVHVKTTNNGVRNPGIMQSHNGVKFDPNNAQASILQMVRDGTEGTASGDGIMQCLAHRGNIYAALREYNSGQVNENDLSDGQGSWPSYVSDIANRLMGAQPN